MEKARRTLYIATNAISIGASVNFPNLGTTLTTKVRSYPTFE
jgi:hypothetical protein